MTSLQAQNLSCNQPLVVNGYVIDKVNPGLVALLTSQNSLNNIIDQDLSNSTQLDLTLIALNSSIVSVKKADGFFNAGKKTGFVFEVPTGLLSVDVLSGLTIRTYRNNVLQEDY